LIFLGSWFVLESWISSTPFRFAKTPAQSDLDVARGSKAKEVLENHWDSWIVEDDWKWIKERGINTVRIPVRRIND
jgi:glucan 1,3-beta-glucosidase